MGWGDESPHLTNACTRGHWARGFMWWPCVCSSHRPLQAQPLLAEHCLKGWWCRCLSRCYGMCIRVVGGLCSDMCMRVFTWHRHRVVCAALAGPQCQVFAWTHLAYSEPQPVLVCKGVRSPLTSFGLLTVSVSVSGAAWLAACNAMWLSIRV